MTANLHVRKIRGNLAYYDSFAHQLVEVIGPDAVKVIEDFIGSPHSSSEMTLGWTRTAVGSSTFAITDGVGGIATITTGGTENDGVNAQMIGEAFELTTDQDLWFGVYGITINDVTQSDFFIGLAITDTDILGGVTDRIGFECLDGSVNLLCMLEKNSSETSTDTTYDMADATAVNVGFYWDGTAGTVSFYVNGVLMAAPVTTNLPNDEALRISWQFLTGEAAAQTMSIDKIVCIQVGR